MLLRKFHRLIIYEKGNYDIELELYTINALT